MSTTTSEDPTTFMSARHGKTLTAVATIIGIVLALQSWGILPYQMGAMERRQSVFEEETKRTFRDLSEERRADRDLIISLQQQLVATQREIQLLRGDLSDMRTSRRGGAP